MSTLERRLQLLLDQERYERVAAEAKKSGRSVNAVIREAIDAHYPPGADARSAAWRRFFDMTDSHSRGRAETLEEIKASLDERFTTSW
jgi:Ribbon-helix-helix protein, copG family